MIHVSAPAKLIMFGEHASRHGKPSIVFAINQRIHAYLEERTDDNIILKAPDMGIDEVEYPSDKLEYMTTAIRLFFDKTGKKGSFTLSTKSEMREGFGSSGAVTVATIGALNEHFKTNLSKFDIWKIGYDTIQEVQSHGSGIDIAAATYGNVIFFRKGKEPEIITKETLPIVIGNTGIKVKSKPIVKAVQELEQEYPEILRAIIDNMGRIGIRAKKALEENDLETVGQLMNINQGMLYGEGVSSLILEKLIFAAKEAGALGAKISGAGIGDNMISLVPPGKEKVVAEAIKKAGGEPTIAKIDDGLRVEE